MPEIENAGGILAGLLNRYQLQKQLDWSRRTVIRNEGRGLPVLRIGKRRYYEITRVNEWLRNGGVRPQTRRRRRGAA